MKPFLSLILSLAVAFFATQSLSAQDSDYQLSLTDGEGVVGGTVAVKVGLDNTAGSDVQGFQWGVCHDDTIVSLDDGNVANGDDTSSLDFTFEAVSYFDGDGWTVGALLNVITMTVLAPGDYPDMYLATYNLDEVGDASIDFCSDLGSPEVAVRVIVDGDEIEPEAQSGTISVLEPPSDTYLFIASNEDVEYLVADGVADFSVTMSVSEYDTNPGFPNDTQGFQLGLSHDGAVVTVVDARPIGELADLNEEEGPAFFGTNFDPENGPGVTIGIVYALMGGVFINFDEEKDMVEFDYESVPTALIGDEDGLTSSIFWNNEMGDPVLPASVVVAGASFDANTEDGSVNFLPLLDVPFIRGDANDDGRVNIADAVTILHAKLIGGAVLVCEAAGDANGDTTANMADAIYVLQYRFLHGPVPAEPFPLCGIDSGADCESFESCE